MTVELVEVTKNTRGINSREIKYKAIGKYTTRIVERESKPEFNADGSPKLDEKGNQVRTPLGKDKDGKLITIKEEVQEFITEGVLTRYEDALELVNNDEQILLDCFAEGYNERAYALEADKDELDAFIADLEMNDEQKTAFKKMARYQARQMDVPLMDAAEEVKAAMARAKAKKEAAAKAAAKA